MDESDLAVARLMERQFLKEKHPLGCGCVIEAKYGHPTQRTWVLVSTYIEACGLHRKLYESFEREKKQDWQKGSFMPKWRDEHGLWVLREEWVDTIRAPESMPTKMQLQIQARNGLFEYKGTLYLLLVGYLGTPVVLKDTKDPKMNGRAICLDLTTGKTFPAPVPESTLRRFGWVKEE